MPTYIYTAIAKTGEKVKGTEIAEDERQLATILREKGYLLTTVKINEKEKKKLISLASFLDGLQKVSLTDKLLFTRNLQVMVEAGIP